MVRFLKLATPYQVKRTKRNKQLLLCEAPKYSDAKKEMEERAAVDEEDGAWLPHNKKNAAVASAALRNGKRGEQNDSTKVWILLFLFTPQNKTQSVSGVKGLCL